jgi:hypothetical protein
MVAILEGNSTVIVVRFHDAEARYSPLEHVRRIHG